MDNENKKNEYNEELEKVNIDTNFDGYFHERDSLA